MDTKYLNEQLTQAEITYNAALARFSSARADLHEMNKQVERMSADAGTKPAALAKVISECEAARLLLPAHEAAMNDAHRHMMRCRENMADAERQQKAKAIKLEAMRGQLASMQHDYAQRESALRLFAENIERHEYEMKRLQDELGVK